MEKRGRSNEGRSWAEGIAEMILGEASDRISAAWQKLPYALINSSAFPVSPLTDINGEPVIIL